MKHVIEVILLTCLKTLVLIENNTMLNKILLLAILPFIGALSMSTYNTHIDLSYANKQYEAAIERMLEDNEEIVVVIDKYEFDNKVFITTIHNDETLLTSRLDDENIDKVNVGDTAFYYRDVQNGICYINGGKAHFSSVLLPCDPSLKEIKDYIDRGLMPKYAIKIFLLVFAIIGMIFLYNRGRW